MQLAFKETGDLELAAIGGCRVIRAEQAGAGDLGDRNAGLQPGVEIIRVDGGEVLLFLLLVAGEQAQVKLRLTNAIGDAVDKPGLVVLRHRIAGGVNHFHGFSHWGSPYFLSLLMDANLRP